MKRPGVLAYLFGNPLSALVLLAATLYFAYGWWYSGVSPWAPLIALAFAGHAMGENEKLQKYWQWKREWALMEGRRPSRWARFAARALQIGLGLCAWCVFGFFALQASGDPIGKVSAALFWATTLLMIVGALRAILRKRRPRRPAKAEDTPVSVCVRRVAPSAGLAAAYAALPPYCRALMAQRQ